MYEAKGTLNWDDTGIQDIWSPVIQDLLNSETVFYAQTPTRKVNSIKYNFFAREGRNDMVGPVLPTDDLIGSSTNKISLTHELKQYRAAVAIEDARVLEAKYNGVGMLKDAWASEFEYTIKDLAQDINTALYADSQTEGFGTVAANPMDGLRGILSTSGNIYGKSRTTYTTLAAKVDSTTTEWTFAAFRGWLTDLRKNGGKDFVVYTTHEIKDIILNKMENNKMYLGTSSAAGFLGAPTVDGIPIVADKDCPANHMFILDKNAYYIAVFEPFGLGSAKPVAKTNLTETRYIWGIQDIVFEKFNTSYKITGIIS